MEKTRLTISEEKKTAAIFFHVEDTSKNDSEKEKEKTAVFFHVEDTTVSELREEYAKFFHVEDTSASVSEKNGLSAKSLHVENTSFVFPQKVEEPLKFFNIENDYIETTMSGSGYGTTTRLSLAERQRQLRQAYQRREEIF